MAEVFRQQQRALLGLGGPETMDAETLVNTPLAAIPFVVSELIPQGLHMIGWAAKIGKSWLMLWLGLRIAKGEPIWNYECKQGTVLYLALEDSYERLQRRLLDITDEGSPHLHCAVVCKTLADGFCQEIDAFIEANPETRMIIVDTFQKIRGDGAGNTNPYAHDYQELSMLKELAAKHGVAILLVHHLRKQGANVTYGDMSKIFDTPSAQAGSERSGQYSNRLNGDLGGGRQHLYFTEGQAHRKCGNPVLHRQRYQDLGNSLSVFGGALYVAFAG